MQFRPQSCHPNSRTCIPWIVTWRKPKAYNSDCWVFGLSENDINTNSTRTMVEKKGTKVLYFQPSSEALTAHVAWDFEKSPSLLDHLNVECLWVQNGFRATCTLQKEEVWQKLLDNLKTHLRPVKWRKPKLLCHDFSLMQQDCLVLVTQMLLMNATFGPFRSELSSDKVHRFLEKELVQPPRPHQL